MNANTTGSHSLPYDVLIVGSGLAGLNSALLLSADTLVAGAGLYAVGESACSGRHSANRLASNSLVDCMVFARAATQAIDASTGTEPLVLPTVLTP